MSNIIFKRLFEVRVQHGYYLDNWFPDATGKPASFYKFEDPLTQQTFVLENKYDFRRDLNIEPTAETEQLLKNQQMRWRLLPTGIVVGIEVDRTGTDTSTQFFSRQTIPPSSSWTFVLRLRNAAYYNITNHALRPTLPGCYYFSNLRAAEEGKQYPSLASQPPAFSSDRTWEMGELIRDNNKILAATDTTEAVSAFMQIAEMNADPKLNTWHHFAHTGDRVALPKKFNYRFDSKFKNSSLVTSVEFTLKNLAGIDLLKIAQNYTTSSPAPLEFLLDFRFLPLPTGTPTTEKPPALPDGWYNLEVTINGSPFETRRVNLRSDLSPDHTLFGVVEISTANTASQFRIINADGSLNVTPHPNIDPLRWQPPVFQIRLMSRLTYWRYRITKAPVNIPPNIDFHYDASLQELSTVHPRHLTQVRSPVELTSSILLPSPNKTDLIYQNNRYYSELFLSTL